MKPAKKNKNQNGSKILLGLGLDSRDEHVRITKGENFHLLGGTEDTHEKMTETAIKFNEKLSSKGKRLDDLSGEEFIDMISESMVK